MGLTFIELGNKDLDCLAPILTYNYSSRCSFRRSSPSSEEGRFMIILLPGKVKSCKKATEAAGEAAQDAAEAIIIPN